MVMLMVWTLMVGTVFTSQQGSQAHAFLPAVGAVVAPTVARTVVVPVARVVCGKVCPAAWGAATTASTAAWCAFMPGTCKVPWQQNPDVPPNGNTVSDGSGYYGTSNVATGPCTGCRYTVSIQKTGTDVHVAVAMSGGAYIGAHPTNGQTIQVNITFVSNTSGIYGYGNIGTNVGQWRANARVEVSFSISTTHSTKVIYHFPPAGSTTSPNFPPYDPDRQGQGYRTCRNSSGTVRTIPGPVVTYKDSSNSREATMPACPSDYPIPTGGGVASGNPWTPYAPIEGTPGTHTPLAPPLQEPDADPKVAPILPDRPGSGTGTGTPSTPRRTPIGTPYKPLPDVDPVTGEPKPDPNDPSKPKPQPIPYFPPDEGPCMWGGYVVAPEDCEHLPPLPRPSPSATPTTTTTTAPNPQPSSSSTPAPVGPPTSGENPPADDGGNNCIAAAWSWNPVDWVFVPVKCALTWAFGIKPSTQARLGSIDVAGIPPFSVLTAVPSWLAPIANPGQSCPDWTVRVASQSYSVVCDQGFTKKMHDNRVLFGTAMTLVLLAPLAWRVWRAAIPVLKVT